MNDDIKNAATPILRNLAQTDVNTLVRAAAIDALAKLNDPADTALYRTAIKNESYAIEGSALKAIAALNPSEGMQLAQAMEKDSEAGLSVAIINIYIDNGGDTQWPYVYERYNDLPVTLKAPLLMHYAALVARVNKPEYAQQGIQVIRDLAIRYKEQGIGPRLIEMLNNVKAARLAKGDNASAQAIDKAIQEIGN